MTLDTAESFLPCLEARLEKLEGDGFERSDDDDGQEVRAYPRSSLHGETCWRSVT